MSHVPVQIQAPGQRFSSIQPPIGERVLRWKSFAVWIWEMHHHVIGSAAVAPVCTADELCKQKTGKAEYLSASFHVHHCVALPAVLYPSPYLPKHTWEGWRKGGGEGQIKTITLQDRCA